jgi:hypothetical protein
MIYPKIKYLLLSTIALLSACERDVTSLKLPEFRQKLAVTSFISPSDTISYFYISSNRKIFGELNTEDSVGELTGTISDGTHETALETIGCGLRINRSKMAVEYGKTYSIEITNGNGLSAAASCTVPRERDFTIKADTFSMLLQSHTPEPYTFRSLEFSLAISDFAGEENYYRISGRSVGYFTDANSGIVYKVINVPWFDKEFFSDEGMDGREIIRLTHFGCTTDHYALDSSFLEITLFNTDRAYYLYHKSLDNYNDGENPFSEVTPVYSNITDGLGIFASYTVDSLSFRIK